jgi:2-polyprenyl-3-methyl-5-hydroxy-6-metoxy-1,4-benzoquinol methylase
MFYPTSTSLETENIVKCRECGLIFTNPRPRLALLRSLYYEGEDRDYIAQQAERINIFQRTIRFIEKFCPGGNILDIGCATGLLLEVARKRNWNTRGVELNRFFADFARMKLNLDVINANVEDIDFPAGSFDVIVMWDSLEHTPDPYLVLSKAYGWLKKGGYIFINFPNVESIFAKIMGKKCWFMVSMHLYHFSSATIKMFFERIGFCYLKKKRHIQHLKLGYLVEKVKAYSSSFYHIINGLTKVTGLENVLMPYYAGQITIVGQK